MNAPMPGTTPPARSLQLTSTPPSHKPPMEHGLKGVPINIRVAAEENGLVVQYVPTDDLEFIQEEEEYGLDHCCNERWFRYADWMLLCG